MSNPIPSATKVADARPPLAYAAPAMRQPWTARRVRYVLLLVAVSALALGLLLNPVIQFSRYLGYGIYGTPVAPIMDSTRGNIDLRAYLSETMIFFGAILGTQWLFLLPRGRLSFQTSDRVRSIRQAVIGGGFIAAIISMGLLATGLELLGQWQSVIARDWSLGGFKFVEDHRAIWLAMLLIWIAWAALFYWYFRDTDHRTVVSRLTRVLLVGTVLELIVAIPSYARSVRKSDDCPCATGSYTGLVFGATALFWLFGPGIYLLFLRERRRWKPRG